LEVVAEVLDCPEHNTVQNSNAWTKRLMQPRILRTALWELASKARDWAHPAGWRTVHNDRHSPEKSRTRPGAAGERMMNCKLSYGTTFKVLGYPATSEPLEPTEPRSASRDKTLELFPPLRRFVVTLTNSVRVNVGRDAE
jgi:hypothetical protein